VALFYLVEHVESYLGFSYNKYPTRRNPILMPHLHMQVCQSGSERKAWINVFLWFHAHAKFSLWRG